MLPESARDLPWVLASASPRRQALLAQFGREFQVVAANLDEDELTSADPLETARELALAKARHVARSCPDSLVIGGDTVVALGQKQFGKPASPKEAAQMLEALSGKTHQVLTGLALVWPDGEIAEVGIANVTFRQLQPSEIEEYANSGEPLDKAGGYAIQGGAKGFVAGVDGEIDCVIGFPTSIFRRLLRL